MKQSEFDQHAETYSDQHAKNIAVSGENPEFFAEYKVADAKRLTRESQVHRILDFGSGIGNSIAYFRKHFDGGELFCADPSRRSLAIAAERFPGLERYVGIAEGARLDLPDG